MVSFNVYRATASGAYVEGVCLTSDEKPIAGISNGSILYAVDTSDGSITKYMYNQSGAAWLAVEDAGGGEGSGGEGGGGEGGGGESNVFPVIFTISGEGTYASPFVVTCDKSIEELDAAHEAGKVFLVRGDFTDLYDAGFYATQADYGVIDEESHYFVVCFLMMNEIASATRAVKVQYEENDSAYTASFITAFAT